LRGNAKIYLHPAVVAPISVIVLLGSINLYLWGWGTAESFQRFGSVNVAASVVLIGMSQTRLTQLVAEGYEPEVDPSAPETHAARVLNRLAQFSEYSLVIWGTLQWGYGDKFFCWFRAGQTC